MPTEPAHDELARRAAELGFRTTADDYRRIGNRLVALRTVLDVVSSIDVSAFEPAPTFEPPAAPGRATGRRKRAG